MFKLITATLAAMYLIAITAGAPEESTSEVARAADPAFEMSLTSFVGAANASAVEDVPTMSEREAIELALATGTELRKNRTSTSRLLGSGLIQQDAAATEPAPRDLWRVTGSTVNLRSGPGTSNGVVAQLTLGTEAEVIEEGSGWYHIRTADGAVDGWIFGKYLAQNG